MGDENHHHTVVIPIITPRDLPSSWCCRGGVVVGRSDERERCGGSGRDVGYHRRMIHGSSADGGGSSSKRER